MDTNSVLKQIALLPKDQQEAIVKDAQIFFESWCHSPEVRSVINSFMSSEYDPQTGGAMIVWTAFCHGFTTGHANLMFSKDQSQ
jgi:hypothetical protein